MRSRGDRQRGSSELGRDARVPASAGGARLPRLLSAIACSLLLLPALPCAPASPPTPAWAAPLAQASRADAQQTGLSTSPDASASDSGGADGQVQAETQDEPQAEDQLEGEGEASSSQVDARVAALGEDWSDTLSPTELRALGGDAGFLPSDIDSSQVTHVTIARLSSADTDLDGKLVSFVGEVVGEPVVTGGGGRWVQLKSSSGDAIEVSMDESMADLIENYGSYAVKGSTLRIIGIYRVADPNNLGNLDVVAYSVSVVDEGGARTDGVDGNELTAALVAVCVAVALLVVKIVLKKRKR
jgi:hypothetical protein